MKGFHPWLLGMIIVFVGAILFVVLAIYGMASKNAAAYAIDKCIDLCEYAKGNKVDLSAGPCLSDRYPEMWNVPDWVCDVAHWPREEVDNYPSNQCAEYREGKAHHFVEVDENCNYIRTDLTPPRR